MTMNQNASNNNPAVLQTCSLLVTAEAIQTYGELTNDFNPLHVDAEFAAKTPMGRQIAHGTMSLCLIFQCIQRNFGGAALANVALDVRFVKPVFIGDTVEYDRRQAVLGRFSKIEEDEAPYRLLCNEYPGAKG